MLNLIKREQQANSKGHSSTELPEGMKPQIMPPLELAEIVLINTNWEP